MVFSKREKLVLAGAIAALCLLVLNFLALEPLLDRRGAVAENKGRLVTELNQAQNLLKRRRLLADTWQRMLAGGLKPDPAEAESQLLRSLRDWSADAGVTLSSLRPERSTEKSTLPEITVDATGTGSMRTVSRLLWRIETAEIPVKVKMLQLGSRRDGTDDLSLHLKVSTLYLPVESGSPDRPAGRTAPTGGGR
jgi:hypothetical protein